LKVDWDSKVIIKELENQYDEKKKLYAKALSSGTKKIDQITKEYTDQRGHIIIHKITPITAKEVKNTLEEARADFIVASKIFG